MSLPLQAPPSPTGLLEFELPEALAAAEPPEARGLARDAVRLMVSRAADDSIIHRSFHDFPDFLAPGDVLVVNTSATINAAIGASRLGPADRERIELHLSTPLPDGRWVVAAPSHGRRNRTAPGCTSRRAGPTGGRGHGRAEAAVSSQRPPD